MKKIELNAPLRFVLVILIWLLTFTVVNLTGTLNNGGAGLIGTLVLYVGALYLSFVYFNDCSLKKACKLSLIVMVIVICCYLVIQCYGYILTAFRINNETAYKIQDALNGIFNIGRNLTIAICLLITLVKTLGETCECQGKCECKKEEKAEAIEADAKEEETPAEETKEEKEAE